MTPQSLTHWLRVANHVMARDASALSELLKLASKTVAAQSGAAPLLALTAARARDADVARARYVKRLAFVLFAGRVDQYVASLPAIQELLVAALRDVAARRLHQEVFLCFRVLVLRFSNSKLRSFWPVILAELIRVFSLGAPSFGRRHRLVVVVVVSA